MEKSCAKFYAKNGNKVYLCGRSVFRIKELAFIGKRINDQKNNIFDRRNPKSLFNRVGEISKKIKMKNFLILSTVAMITMIFTSCGESSKENEESLKEGVIGKQEWMNENLNVEKFSNGDPIPHAKTKEEWKRAGDNEEPAWCYYNNNPDNGDRYGKLYNWYAVNDPRSLAPEGWRIPSKEDWSRLIDFLGGESLAGKKMKFTDFWADNEGESGNGTNESGFSGLPGGYRSSDGIFKNLVNDGRWWSSSEDYTYLAWYCYLKYSDSNVSRYSGSKKLGLSVRCLRD